MPLFPTYVIDASKVFPELIPCAQSTAATSRHSAALALVFAYLAGGQWFEGVLSTLTIEDLTKEIDEACLDFNLDAERIARWAESLLIEPEATLPADLDHLVVDRLEGPGFTLHPYQRDSAKWAAHRLGSVLALGCGVGKTGTAVAAARTAAAIGRCSAERCIVLCPLNAMHTWNKYVADLRLTFREVSLLSCDSLHLYQHMDREQGGALIIDEAHKLKNVGRNRTEFAHSMRSAFEWSTCLTGSLLHTGAEGVMSILDLACPGLSRYIDKWVYGEAFSCIVKKKIDSGPARRQLGLVPEEHRQEFTNYLKRGVRSLSLESPEVAERVNLLGQERIQMDVWEVPEWVRDLNSDPSIEVFDGWTLGHPDPDFEGDQFPAVFTADMVSMSHYYGALSLALQYEREGQLLTILKEEGHDLDTREQAVAKIEELCKEFMEDKVHKEHRKLAGLPSFNRVLHEATKDGRYDRAIATVKLLGPEGKTRIDFRFVSPHEGRLTPGPKIQALLDWLNDNPDEPLVVGAASVKTLDMVEALLKDQGIEYRLIRGGVPAAKRTEYIDGFQAGEFRVMLLQQVAGSESVDLVRAAWSVLVDHDWSPITYTQYLARTYRQGQTRHCVHIDMAFGATQRRVVDLLLRGEAFDAEIRSRLEQEVRYER